MARLEERWPASPTSRSRGQESPCSTRLADWRYQCPRGTSFSSRYARQQRRPLSLSRGLLNPLHKHVEDTFTISLPVVVAEGVLVQVRLKVLGGDAMIDAADSALQQRPKPFDGVRVNVPIDVDVLAMVNAPMVIALLRQRLVGVGLIGVDDGLFEHLGCDFVEHCTLDVVGHDFGRDGSRLTVHPTLRESKHLGLALNAALDAGSASSASPVRFAADVGLINLDGAFGNRRVALIHERADAVEHAPRRLVGHAKLALKLFRGDTAASAGHQVERVEPQAKRRGRILKDGSGHRVLAVPAVFTRIRGAVVVPVVLRHLVALWAVNPVRIELAYQPIKAGSIVREITVKLKERVARFRSSGSSGLVAIYLGHTPTIRLCSTAVKGIIPSDVNTF